MNAFLFSPVPSRNKGKSKAPPEPEFPALETSVDSPEIEDDFSGTEYVPNNLLIIRAHIWNFQGGYEEE